VYVGLRRGGRDGREDGRWRVAVSSGSRSLQRLGTREEGLRCQPAAGASRDWEHERRQAPSAMSEEQNSIYVYEHCIYVYERIKDESTTLHICLRTAPEEINQWWYYQTTPFDFFFSTQHHSQCRQSSPTIESNKKFTVHAL